MTRATERLARTSSNLWWTSESCRACRILASAFPGASRLLLDCCARTPLSDDGFGASDAPIRVGPTRSEHLEAARISSTDIEVLLDARAMVVEPVRISYLWRPILRDAGDDLVLETAVNGQADIVVTFNRRHFEPATTFGLEILSPADAVRRLESRQ